ncbi:unnamed protein product [Schistosoma margrebowiei]|uniref:Uncharacterized protein n=1 Tax=Schistosoma margrebowiei TaxID=48269 RepID=A0A183LYH9_9TREM|nr:unnamed protein product [Schistosoma margrebowiei]
MGTFFSKRQSVEFTLIPSEEISGPLGLGKSKIKFIHKITFVRFITEWSNCSQKYYWAAMYICKTDFHKALECNKR